MQKRTRNTLLFLIGCVIVFSIFYWLKNGKSGNGIDGEVVEIDSTDKGVITQKQDSSDTSGVVDLSEMSAIERDSILDEEVEKKLGSSVESATLWSVPFKKNEYYTAPLNGDLTLSGTFGELRQNHFHAGLDLRTGGVEGAEVYAAADGYVSRLRVMERGYGKAIYIQHPNGTTTVYGHLQRFNGNILDAAMKQHYSRESYEFEWFPPAGALKVKKGQIIAYSGNTGGSGGPHLHFEIREGNGQTYNPLLYNIKAKDGIAPRIQGIILLEIDESTRAKTGTFNWTSLSKSKGTITVEPGKYGVAANWVDYFTDYLNRLGINYAALIVDGKPIFKQTLNHFAFDQGRLINQQINHYHYVKTGIRYTKLFKDRGNTLPINSGNGTLQLKDGEKKKVEIVIRDVDGNEDRFSFNIECSKKGAVRFSGATDLGGKLYSSNKYQAIKTDHAKVEIPANTMYNDFYLKVYETETSADLASPMIRIADGVIPVHKSLTIAIWPKKEYEPYLDKLVFMEYNSQSRSSSAEGGKVTGNSVTEYMKHYGIYYLKLDTIAPKVTFKQSGRTLSAHVYDNLGEISSYRGTLDGKWVLFEYEYKKGQLKAVVPESFESGKHQLVLIVKDLVGNQKRLEMDVVF